MNLKKAAQKKLKKSGGFTLVEMLIVVAIIAILVVVTIPMVNSNLEKAREATDAANERAAKAAAMVTYMAKSPAPTSNPTYYYKDDGTISEIAPTNKKGYEYGQGTSGGDVDEDNAGKYVKITIDIATGVASTEWAAVSSSSTGG